MIDRLAEVLLRTHKPERYSEKLMVAGQVNGRVDHVHHLAPATVELVRSIAGVGAPAAIDGAAEKVGEPRQITAAGIVSEMLGRGGREATKASDPQDVAMSSATKPGDEGEDG